MKSKLIVATATFLFAQLTWAATPTGAAEKWMTECSGCHVAYPAKFLPAGTWKRMMANLDKHFGSDASLDVQTARDITSYLTANAAGDKRNEDPASLRISDTRWFQRAHSEEMDPALFKSAQVKSPANCGACHVTAAKGNYSEHNIRIPGQGNRKHEED